MIISVDGLGAQTRTFPVGTLKHVTIPVNENIACKLVESQRPGTRASVAVLSLVKGKDDRETVIAVLEHGSQVIAKNIELALIGGTIEKISAPENIRITIA